MATRTRAPTRQSLQRHPQRNTVFLGGDIHQKLRMQRAKADRPCGRSVLASEFRGTSITQVQLGATQEKVDAIARHNPVLLARCDLR